MSFFIHYSMGFYPKDWFTITADVNWFIVLHMHPSPFKEKNNCLCKYLFQMYFWKYDWTGYQTRDPSHFSKEIYHWATQANYYTLYNHKYKIYNLGNFKLKSHISLTVEDDKIFIKQVRMSLLFFFFLHVHVFVWSRKTPEFRLDLIVIIKIRKLIAYTNIKLFTELQMYTDYFMQILFKIPEWDTM